MDDLREVIARAIAKADRVEICSDASYRHSAYGGKADAALAAIKQAGFVVVPAEETIAGASDERLRLETFYRKFLGKVEKGADGECWQWVGCIDKRDGYGRFYPGNSTTNAAHRFSYEYHNGPLTPGTVIDHTCRNRSCVNPAHLRQVDNTENVLCGDGPSAKNASKTHCKRGHQFSGDNVYIAPNGSRNCRTCHREKIRAYRARKKAAMIEASNAPT